MKKINKKIPGVLPPPPKTEIDGKITDLSSKTLPELQELKERQLKLLNNKTFISKLADKGEKIQSFYNKIVEELKSRQEEYATCNLLNKLNLNNVDEQLIQNVEWEGKLDTINNTCLDSDDDSEPEDVLRIISQHTQLNKQVKTLQQQKPLITTEDLINIGELPHVKYLVQKTESNPKLQTVEKFKPFKTTKTDVHDPNKEIHRKKHKNWEVTAATPPPSIHGPAKVLSLEESLNLQKEYNKHIKEIEAQHAAEKLLSRAGIKMAEMPKDVSKFGKYRDLGNYESDISDTEGSDKEIHDDEPEKGGVIFTVMS